MSELADQQWDGPNISSSGPARSAEAPGSAAFKGTATPRKLAPSRVPSGSVPGEVDPRTSHGVPASPGLPIPASQRNLLEALYGEDLSSVRMSVDEKATRNLGATAFSVGSQIVLGSTPGSSSETFVALAHEVAHVIQNRRAQRDPRQLSPISSDSDPAEVEAAGASRGTAAGQRVSIHARPSTVIQRQTHGRSAPVSGELVSVFEEVVQHYNDIENDRLIQIGTLKSEVEKPIENEPDLAEEIMLAAVKAAVGNVTSTIAEKILEKLSLNIETKSIEKEVEKTLAVSFNKAMTTGLEEAQSKGAKELFSAASEKLSSTADEAAKHDHSDEQKSPSGARFIELHQIALVAESRRIRDNFIKQLPNYAALEQKTPGTGVAAMQRVEESINEEYNELTVERPQFNRSLTAWMNYLAVAALGKHTPTTKGESPGAELGGGRLTMPGVLTVAVIFPPDPAKPVQVAEIRVAGLQKELRKELEGRSISSLGVSVVLESVFGSEPWRISRNEGGTVFISTPAPYRDRFIRYLSAKVGQGDHPSEEAAFTGARIIIEQEVGPHKIKNAMTPTETVWSRVPPEMTSWPPSG